MTLQSVTVNGAPVSRVAVTIGTVHSNGGQLRTSVDQTAMIWTPSASAIGVAGNAAIGDLS